MVSMDAKEAYSPDLLEMARARMEVGPVPAWVSNDSYDGEYRPAMRGAITHLLIEQQVHAELHQTYVRRAVRLETMQAVQHQSQWRFEFEPQTQSVVLHTIKTRRGGQETNHLDSRRIQFLRREANLDGFVIDGWVTLLLLLEDVQSGDVLEWSWTVTAQPRLLRENITSLYTLPPGIAVGRFRFSVRHAARRTLNWSAWLPSLVPTTIPDGAESLSFWQGEDLASPQSEELCPSWYVDHPWIQVSDCPDWQTVASAIAEAWEEDPEGEGLAALVADVQGAGSDALARAGRAIELVQDRFRYLSVNLEMGGQIPAPSERVAQRRYGDCKDLAFLLVRLLRAVGIAARPVLVNTRWGRSISGMLPSPGIFDHCVVEYEVDGTKRWVDATMKCQGGGAPGRCVPDFGLGLPLDPATTELAPVPKASQPCGTLEVKESFLLDTAGSPSSLAILITGKGMAADGLRFEFENEGVEAIARKHLQTHANRFSKAARIGQLQFRDDRENNEFVVAEAFEIDGFLRHDGGYETCLFCIQSDFTAGYLLCPPTTVRRSPLSLPFPCNRTHIIELDFNGLNVASIPVFQVGDQYVRFSRKAKTLPKYLRVTFSLDTFADSIPPERLQDHRKAVETIWQASLLQLRLPTGYARMRRRGDFGALPPARGKPATKCATAAPPPSAVPVLQQAAMPSPPPPAVASAAADRGAVAQLPAETAPLNPPRRRSSRSQRRGRNHLGTVGFVLFLGAFSLFLIAGKLDRTPFDAALGMALFLITIVGVSGSLTLAGVGLRQCIRHPGRYTSGKDMAVLTLGCSGLFALILLIAMVVGVGSALVGAMGHQPAPQAPAGAAADAR